MRVFAPILVASVLVSSSYAASSSSHASNITQSPNTTPSSWPALTQQQQQLLRDRLFQTNLRGPRWTGNDNQNVLTDLVTQGMMIAGLSVETLNYTLNRWDPRWWSLTLHLKNGTDLGLPTTGYWPYSGDSGLRGVTAPLHDAGTYGLFPDQTHDEGTLDFSNLPEGGAVVFFDNPSPTRNYSLPGYHLLGTSRDIPPSLIPELGNLTNPHWQSEKKLNFTELKAKGVQAVIASWVNTSDENAALQFLPNAGAPGNGSLYEVPALYVGNSTGELIREMIRTGEAQSATVVLDAPSFLAPSKTVVGHLTGKAGREESILLYTHSDGPSIIEENGPILLLTIAEYFAKNPLNISLDIVVTTGHMSGGHLDETLWMSERPQIRRNARAAVVCEHFGALEWKDTLRNKQPTYEATGRWEPMWTMANDHNHSDLLHQLYTQAFEGTSEQLRMALLAPQVIGNTTYQWYGAGGSSVMGRSDLPTIGIIPQPDYLWAAMPDGGWSKLDIDMAVEQINVVLRTITGLDRMYSAGQL